MSQHPNTSKITAGSKLYFPPLLQFIVYGLSGYVLAMVFPAMSYSSEFVFWLSIPLAGIGLFLLILAVRSFGKAHTTVNPIEPTKADQLVTSGLYRFTRNPMYLGLLLVMLAGSLTVQNMAALCGPVLFFISMTIFQIKPEERVLERKFGKDYTDYCQQTRRWI